MELAFWKLNDEPMMSLCSWNYMYPLTPSIKILDPPHWKFQLVNKLIGENPFRKISDNLPQVGDKGGGGGGGG